MSFKPITFYFEKSLMESIFWTTFPTALFNLLHVYIKYKSNSSSRKSSVHWWKGDTRVR